MPHIIRNMMNIDITTGRSFEDLQADFYHYLRDSEGGNLAPKTSGDYISRMRFLSRLYTLDDRITKEKVDEIMKRERTISSNRDKYNTPHAMSDLHSGLMKFLAFVQSDYYQSIFNREKEELRKVEQSTVLSTTEKAVLVKARIGQGLFRKRLFDYWHGCSITQCDIPWFLIASHIKPWCNSDNEERIDVYNGLLLTPDYDKLFDSGYISFTITGNILISPFLSRKDRDELKLSPSIRLHQISSKHGKYLAYHQEHVFLV